MEIPYPEVNFLEANPTAQSFRRQVTVERIEGRVQATSLPTLLHTPLNIDYPGADKGVTNRWSWRWTD